LRQAFERKLVSSRQCCSSQGSHYAAEIGRSSLSSSKTPSLLTWFGPFEYYLFPNLKKDLKGITFLSFEAATITMDEWFVAQPKEFFFQSSSLLLSL
jgi:hypothetical protein